MEQKVELKTEEKAELSKVLPKLRAVGINELGWKYTKEILGVKDLQNFVFLLKRRDISNTQVTKLKKVLLEGKHFETPLVCNKVNHKWRLIDGNHRLESITKFFKDYPTRRVEVGICYYEKLDEDAEKEMFTTWNLGRKQSTSDVIKMYWDDMPITKKLVKPLFPTNVKHAWCAGGLPLKQLLGPYLIKDGRIHSASPISYGGNAFVFVELASRLGTADYQVLREFLKEYIEIYGEVDSHNPMYKSLVFEVVQHIWLKNKDRMPPDKMKQKLLNLRGHERAMNWSRFGESRSNLELCKRDFLSAMNSNATKESHMLLP